MRSGPDNAARPLHLLRWLHWRSRMGQQFRFGALKLVIRHLPGLVHLPQVRQRESDADRLVGRFELLPHAADGVKTHSAKDRDDYRNYDDLANVVHG